MTAGMVAGTLAMKELSGYAHVNKFPARNPIGSLNFRLYLMR